MTAGSSSTSSGHRSKSGWQRQTLPAMREALLQLLLQLLVM
jgi:hypothetical protein